VVDQEELVAVSERGVGSLSVVSAAPGHERDRAALAAQPVSCNGIEHAGRFAFEPGWKWSECLKPVVGTDSCQARHVGVIQSGTPGVAHEDGSKVELRAGEAYVIEPGHDAWVVGDQRVVAFEFESRAAEECAREQPISRTVDRGDAGARSPKVLEPPHQPRLHDHEKRGSLPSRLLVWSEGRRLRTARRRSARDIRSRSEREASSRSTMILVRPDR
jgi:hypothetical protein